MNNDKITICFQQFNLNKKKTFPFLIKKNGSGRGWKRERERKKKCLVREFITRCRGSLLQDGGWVKCSVDGTKACVKHEGFLPLTRGVLWVSDISYLQNDDIEDTDERKYKKQSYLLKIPCIKSVKIFCRCVFTAGLYIRAPPNFFFQPNTFFPVSYIVW